MTIIPSFLDYNFGHYFIAALDHFPELVLVPSSPLLAAATTCSITFEIYSQRQSDYLLFLFYPLSL